MENILTASIAPLPMEQRSSDNVQFEMARVLDILDCAEEVITQDALLEPTPIGPRGVQSLVHEVPLTENMWHQDQSFVDVLNPLLGFQHQQQLQQSDSLFQQDNFLKDFAFPRAKRQCIGFPSKDGSSSLFELPTKPQMPSATSAVSAIRIRQYQSDQWSDRFQDLVDFKEQIGHCLVPHNYPLNQQLAQWVKRQRYQFKLKNMSRHSTLTGIRQEALEEMGFVWDSHKAAWIERLEALKLFKAEHSHCNVPSNYDDRALAIWVKCQRRQYKLYTKGERSTITEERFRELDGMDLDWNPRNL
jgi:hypothetical protein